MRLVQIGNAGGERRVALVDGSKLRVDATLASTDQLVTAALNVQVALKSLALSLAYESGLELDYGEERRTQDLGTVVIS